MEKGEKGLFAHFDALGASAQDLLVNLAEAHYKTRQESVEGREPTSEQKETSHRQDKGSDLLYDLTRLGLEYTNQLIQVGAAYAFVPSRIMERVQASMAPMSAADDAQKQTLMQTIGAGKEARFTFQIPNHGEQTQTIGLSLAPFTYGNQAPAKELSARLELRGKTYVAQAADSLDLKAEVDPGVPLTVAVIASSTEHLESERRFETTATIDAGEASGHVTMYLVSE